MLGRRKIVKGNKNKLSEEIVRIVKRQQELRTAIDEIVAEIEGTK